MRTMLDGHRTLRLLVSPRASLFKPRWRVTTTRAACGHNSTLVLVSRSGLTIARRSPLTVRAVAETSTGGSTEGSEDAETASKAPKKRTRRAKAASASATVTGEAADGLAATDPGAADAASKPKRRRSHKAPAAATDAAEVSDAPGNADDGDAAPRRGRRRQKSLDAAAAGLTASGKARRRSANQSGSGCGLDTEVAVEAGPLAVSMKVVFSSKLPAGPAWSAAQRWVVFSDLHVRESSLATCLEVLTAVETEAIRRDAGIMFLGDFWDKRGVLPVEPLNQVLQVMSQWRCPVLMLVGNHDQVDLGGLQHGLTPLELACPHVHVFDEPTIWNGALWLPYRREAWVLEAAMSEAMRRGQEGGAEEAGRDAGEGEGADGGGGEGMPLEPLRAIFLHADVRTARTNQWRQAEEGLEPGAFPPSLPVYSGHYHLPHTVRGTNITYVGSPYQVSMNEASESKRLLVLDAASWNVLEEVPLAVGPRHVRLSGPAACDSLRNLAAAASASVATAMAEGSASEPEGEEGEGTAVGVAVAAGGSSGAVLRAGDRVKLWLSTAEALEQGVVEAVAELERAGVTVERVLQPEARGPRVRAAEGLSVDQMLDLYCGAPPGAAARALAEAEAEVAEVAVEAVPVAGGVGGLSEAAAAAVRQVVAAAREAAGAGGEGEGPAGRCVELQLDSVTLRGFGPFVEEQMYPLTARGVRVIAGENRDEPGADSNGAGKTTLVTAPLWALTGDVLARTESGVGRVAVDSMRNDECASATVALRGRLNGEDFEVEREVKRGKTSALRLRLGEEDLTLQDISSTAERIRRLFSTDLLRCSAFFGQNDITALLEANDATFKQKLGLVVDLEVWESARELLAGPRKAAAAEAAAHEGRVRLLREQEERRLAEVEQLVEQEEEWAEQHEELLAQHEATVRGVADAALRAAAAVEPQAVAARVAAGQLRAAAIAAEEEQRAWEAELRAERARRQAVAAASATAHGSSNGGGPQQDLRQQQDHRAGGSTATAQEEDEEGCSEAQSESEEETARGLLRERQEEAAGLRNVLVERQHAASQALGRLRQLEASLQEYVGAVAQLTKAAAAAVPGPEAAARTQTVGRSLQGVSPDARALLGQRRSESGRSSPSSTMSANGTGSVNGHGANDNGANGHGANGYELLQLDPKTGRVLPVAMAAGGHDVDGWGEGVGNGTTIRAVCDRCRQPINEELYESNVERLRGGIAEAQQSYDEAAGELREAERAYSTAAQLAQEADAEVAALVRRKVEAQSREAARAKAAAAAAEQQARQAAEAARRAQEAAWRDAERALQGLQAKMAASTRLRGDLLAAAADLDRVAAELDHAAAAAAPHQDALRRDAGGAEHPVLSTTPDAWASSSDPSPSQSEDELEADPQPAAPAAVELLSAAGPQAVEGRRAAQAVTRALAGWQAATVAAEGVRREVNPRTGLRERAQSELQELAAQREAAEVAGAAADAHLRALADADRALGRTGIPSLVLEDVLAQLQTYTSQYLEHLCEGFFLELSPTKPFAGSATGRGSRKDKDREKDEISKVVKVRGPDGSLRPRDVRQLSGGERRRVALALCLGFEVLVRSRRRLVCNVIVLDEVLQQLDNTGCELVAGVLRDLPHASVLVVGQTNSSVTANFDLLDVVVKEGGASHVRMAV